MWFVCVLVKSLTDFFWTMLLVEVDIQRIPGLLLRVRCFQPFHASFLKSGTKRKKKKSRESEEWVVIWQAGLTLICFLTKWARNYKYFNQCRDLLKHWRFSWSHLNFSDVSFVLYSKAQFLKFSFSFIKVMQQD